MDNYVTRFEKLGFGMFVHFGLYSVIGKGEWVLDTGKDISSEKYESTLPARFKIAKNWAKELVATAKKGGCKYITLTTRHHDGFSLYDTKGLNDYDAPHSAAKRDLIREFVDECNAQGIVPFFYHTLLDWHNKDFENDFPKYIDYLVKSVEILCTNYGKIGGLWFDGMWSKPNENWQEDRLYSMIRKYQPEAMIINNTGLSELGKVGHPELDSVTFERGKPSFVDNSDRHRAGEMCQIFNDHWGYAKEDINYKSMGQILGDLVDCRHYNCNFLLNTGLMGNGKLRSFDKCYYEEIGKWIKKNKDFIYDVKDAEIEADNAYIMKSENGRYYAVIKDVPMAASANVQGASDVKKVVLHTDRKIKSVKWLDNGKRVKVRKNSFDGEPFMYGRSWNVRVAEIVFD